MKKVIILIIYLILFLIYGCSSPFSSTDGSSDVVYVDINNKSGKEDGSFNYPFTSISKAVKSAKEGATIIVRPGTYREMQFTMKRGQRLQGSGAENTVIERKGSGVIVLNSGCGVSGFYIKSQWSGTVLDPAISGENVENIKIFNNKFYYPDSSSIFLENASGEIFNNHLNKILISGCQELKIENNNIEGIPKTFAGTLTYGIGILIISSSPIVRNNYIHNCDIGIDISTMERVPSSPTIYNNKIEDNKSYGIWIRPFPCEADLGGGKRGSPGGNIIRNNGEWDLLNESPSEIYAQHNSWTHSTEEEIDRYDICDDDEGKGGKVIFVPFKEGKNSKR